MILRTLVPAAAFSAIVGLALLMTGALSLTLVTLIVMVAVVAMTPSEAWMVNAWLVAVSKSSALPAAIEMRPEEALMEKRPAVLPAVML